MAWNKIWGVRVYIINGRAKRKKLDNKSHRGCFMVYAATTGVILYWKPDQTFIIHRAHHVWFDEYNSRLSIEDKHTTGSLLLRKILKIIFIIQTYSMSYVIIVSSLNGVDVRSSSHGIRLRRSEL